MILRQCSAAPSRTPSSSGRVSSLVRPGTIAGDGTIAGGIKSGSIHPFGARLRRIGAHHFVPALGRLGSGARIALAAIAPTGQACDHPEVAPEEVGPEEVGLNVLVRVVPNDRAQVVLNGPVRDVPSDRAQVVPSGPAGDVRSDQPQVVPNGPQPVRNGHAMHGRNGLRLVSSDLSDGRNRDRREGRNRKRAIAGRTGPNSRRAHSNVPVRNSKQGRGRRLDRRAAVVRSNAPDRRERGLKAEGIKGKAIVAGR